MSEYQIGGQSITERPAEPGELCTCGRPALTVYEFTDGRAPIGGCGIQDGGSRQGPCPFCGDPRSVRDAHDGRCPDYRLRPAPADDFLDDCSDSATQPPHEGEEEPV